MSFLQVANERFVYYVAIGVLLVVLAVLLSFLIIALRQARKLGITSAKISLTVRTTLLVSIGPAFSVLVPFIAMMGVLGIPWSWLRLSVIGSASQEMAAAGMILQGGGYEGLGEETRVEAFCLYALVVGIIYSSGMLINILFNKPISTTLARAKDSKNAAYISIISGAMFLGLILHISENSLIGFVRAHNVTAIAVMLTGFAVCFVGETLIEKYHWKKLKEYSFAVYLVINMCTALVWNQIL